jgi:hypothetical protein
MSEKAPGIGTEFTDIWVIEHNAIYEIPQGTEEKKEGLVLLEEMYKEELKQTKIPFDKLAEITKTKVKRDDPEFLRGYS